MTPDLHRPEPVDPKGATPVDPHSTPEASARALRAGERLLLTDTYGRGADILDALQALMPAPSPSAPYEVRQAHRRTHREASLRLLAPISAHALALEGARPIGFLQELYPGTPRFHLPFVQVQELHGAWYRHLTGVHLAVLGHKIHPFYGTYVPTRLTHLELFATWLSQYEGPKDRAIDIGTGCGVMALMLCRAGFGRVLATDHNPNAVESVRRELARMAAPPPLEVRHADFFGEDRTRVELIAFNPPWTQGEVASPLDEALYYEPGLFERFFDQAIPRLLPSGRIVLLFSNVIELMQPDVPHPIQAELDRGRLRLVHKQHRRVPGAATGGRKPRKTRERVEVWELALAA